MAVQRRPLPKDPKQNTSVVEETQADPTDVLDVALQIRKKNKEPFTEAEARKQKITVPKPLKHKITGSEVIDLVPADGKRAGAVAVQPTVKPDNSKEAKSNPAKDIRVNPADPSDPLDMAF